MDNNRIDQLMDEGWKQLSVTLDSELPSKRERRYLFVWLIFSGMLFSGLLFYFYKINKVSNIDSIEIKSKTRPNFIANQTEQNQLKTLNNDNNEQKEIHPSVQDSKFDQYSNEHSNNLEKGFASKGNKIPAKEHINSYESLAAFSTVNVILKNEDIVQTSNQKIKDRNEIVELNNSENYLVNKTDYLKSNLDLSHKEESLYSITNLPFSFKLPLFSLSYNSFISGIKPQISIEDKLFSFGIRTSAAFTGLEVPTNYKVGVYGQRSLSKRWFTELSLNYQKFNQYQVIHHNGENFNNILYQDIQVSSGVPAGRVLNSIYVNNSKNLTVNQLGIVDESILSTSLRSIDFINAEFGTGYRITNRLSMLISLSLAKRINTSYEINNTNSLLFDNFNNKPIDQSKLKFGDQLLRKWIYAGAGGLEYKLSEKIAMRSQFLFIPALHTSQLANQESLDKNVPSSVNFDVRSSLSDSQIPGKGSLSLELGFVWRMK